MISHIYKIRTDLAPCEINEIQRAWSSVAVSRLSETTARMTEEETAYGIGKSSAGSNMSQESRNMLQETYYPGYGGEPEASGAMTLDSLQDPPPGTKPRYPYSTLIRYASFVGRSRLPFSPCVPVVGSYAIKGSPHGRLLLEDIYYALGKPSLRFLDAF